MGNSSEQQTMLYMAHIVQRANEIFTATNWDAAGSDDLRWSGYGFQIKNIIVWNETDSNRKYVF